MTLPVPSRRRAAISNLVLSYGVMALTLVQGLLLVPMYVSYIPVPLYGSWLATGNVLAWVGLVDSGLATVLQQRAAFYLGARNPERLASLVGTGILLSLCLASVSLMALVLAGPAATFVRAPPAGHEVLVRSFRLAVISMAIALAGQGFASLNQGLQLATICGVSSFVGGILGIGLTISMLLRGHGLLSIPAGLTLRSISIFLGNAIALGWWCRRYLDATLKVDGRELRTVGKTLTFTGSARLGSTLVGQMDALITARVLSPTAAAVLTITGRAVDIVKMAGERIALSPMAGMSHLHGEGNMVRTAALCARLVQTVGWISAAGAGVAVTLNADFIRLWVGKELFGGQAVTALLALASAAALLGVTRALIVVSLGDISRVAYVGIAEATVKLPLQVVTMRFLGILGVPIGAFVAGACTSGWYLSRALARRLNESKRSHIKCWLKQLGWTGLMVAAGTCAQAGLLAESPAETWPAFSLRLAITAVAFGCVPFIAEPWLRHRVTTALISAVSRGLRP